MTSRRNDLKVARRSEVWIRLFPTALLTSLLACLCLTGAAMAVEFGDGFGLEEGSLFAGTCELPEVTGTEATAEEAREKRDCHRTSTLAPQTAVPVTQAGAHPDASTTFTFKPTSIEPGPPYPEGSVRDVIFDLPPGIVGDPTATPTCPQTVWALSECPLDTQVGIIDLRLSGFQNPQECNEEVLAEIPQFAYPSDGPHCRFPIINVAPGNGETAAFGFNFYTGINAGIEPVVRSDGDFGIQLRITNIPQAPALSQSTATLWGVPGAPQHDAFRFNPTNAFAEVLPPQPWPSTTPVKPFLTNPTSCDGSEPRTMLMMDSWQHPGTFLPNGSPSLADPNWNVEHIDSPPVTGCNGLEFSPTLTARPTTSVADSPSGLDVDLQVPQNEDPGAAATAQLKDTKVTLPEGLVVNPSAANGLGACTSTQIGLTTPVGDPSQIHFDKSDPTCPDSSKIGTAQVITPLLADPIDGSVYLAKQQDNPFGSLLALYLVLQSPERGLTVKLAGHVAADFNTGRLTATFANNPQLPFSEFKLNFRQGAGAPLRTPTVCGAYSTTSELTPWSAPESGPPTKASNSYAVDTGPSGACANSANALPNAPSFDAGSTSAIAGARSPLVINLRREDGTQQFSSLTLTPPQGVVGKLAGIPYCSDAALTAAAAKSGRAEEANQSCPAASYVGGVIAGAGAGPSPYYASGKAYLTGPYKGAPLSLAIITPATAGPFDLGTIVVRTALRIDRKTAQITAVSDPIPSILQGIPLDVRSIQVKLDRPDFVVNPTSCDPTSFAGQALSTLGQAAPLQSRFQLAECSRLGFKPKLTLSLKGATKRGKHPALTAVLKPRAGDANLSSISVALPHSEFLAQEHIRTVCTRVQFAADACPKGAIYGTATVTTPLLDYPLTGPVYLRSSDNKLPDLVPDLRGPASQPIMLEADGRIDSVHGGIRNTFDFVPDAPFTKLTLRMQGGKRGLLVNSRDICRAANKATVKYGAHNGDTWEARSVLKAQCSKAEKHHKRRSYKRHG